MKKGFAQRLISMMVAVCMILTLCPVGVLAGNVGDPSTITAGELVAGAYGALSQAEKDLIGSGLLADVTYEYYVPGEEDELIEVDTENQTITAEEWSDTEGNIWTPIGAKIIVAGSDEESVTLVDGVGTYAYDGNAFSVDVSYEMYISVDSAVQEQLLNTSGWLKEGIATLDIVDGQKDNMALLEVAVPVLWDIRDKQWEFADPAIPPMVLFSDVQKATITELNDQVTANNGMIDLHAKMIDYKSGQKTEFLLNHGNEIPSELETLIAEIDTLLSILNKVDGSISETLVASGDITAGEAEMLSLLVETLEELEAELQRAKGGDWTAADMGTALVKSGITAAEYAQLDTLVTALGQVKTADDINIVERFLAGQTTIRHNLSMKNVTVQVELKVVENVVDSATLVSGGKTMSTVLTLMENANKAEIEAALAEVTTDLVNEAIEAWGDAYVAEHYEYDTTDLPETLTNDIIYTITYSPVTYTITYDYTQDKVVPYGYQTRLESYPDSSMVYDYTVNGNYLPQGSVHTVVGDVTISRTTGKPYSTTDLYTVIANMDGISDKEKAILTSGALKDNAIINVRYPDTDAGVLVSVDNLVLSAKTYNSDYNGLIWKPYSYIVTNGAGTDEELAYFGEPDEGTCTATITDDNFREIKVYYRLTLKNFGTNTAQDVLDLVEQLVEEAKGQRSSLASLSGPNVSENLKMLNGTKIAVLKTVVDKTDLHENAAKNAALKACFTAALTALEDDCLDSDEELRINKRVQEYKSSGESLAYYYTYSEAFVDEVALLTQHLDEMLAGEEGLSADEKLAALRVLIGEAGFDQEQTDWYAQKLPDLQKKMDEIDASLIPANDAIDTSDPVRLNKLVSALEMPGDVGTVYDDYVYLKGDSFFSVAGSGLITLKVTVICEGNTDSVSVTVAQDEPILQDAIDTLKTKVDALLVEMGIDDERYWGCEEYEGGVALNELLGQSYATNQSISFTWVYLNPSECDINGHKEVTIPGTPATCTGTGLTDGVKCSVCGEILTEQEVIPVAPHTEQTVPGKAPTCTGTGLTDGVKCSVCHKVLVEQEIIDAQGHDFNGDWDKDETGHWHVCQRGCGAKDTVIAHTYDTDNCAEQAECTKCHYIKAADQHSWGSLEKVDDNDHKQVCSSCGEELKTPHSWTLVEDVAATCEKDGHKKYTCSCSAEKTDVQPMLGHNWGAWTKLNNEQHQRVCANATTANCVQTENHTWDEGVLNEDEDLLQTCTAQCGATQVVQRNKEEKLESGATIKIYDLVANQELRRPKEDGFEGSGYRYDYTIGGVTYKVTNDGFSPILSSVSGATVKLVNIDNEKLEKLVKEMGESAALEKDSAKKPTQDGYYTGIKVETDAEGVMDVVTTLVKQSEYGYVALGGEPLLENGQASLLALLRMMMTDGKYTSQDIINLSNGTDMALISNRLVLSATAPSTYALRRATAENDGHELDFQIQLTETPAEVEKIGAALTKVKDYVTFDIKPAYDQNGDLVSNGLEIDVKANLPEKVYEIYVAALRLAGKVDVNDANAVKEAVAYEFLKDYVDVLMGAEVTTTTLMNTAAKLGKTVDLSEYEDLFDAVKGKLGYGQNIFYGADGLYATVTLNHNNMQQIVDRLAATAGDADLDLLKDVLVECQDGETVDVKLNGFVVNFADGDDSDDFIDTDYEAIIFDVGAAKKPGMEKADIIDITENLAASVAGFQSAAVVMLQKDVTADLHFKHPTILDLNGRTIDGTITADGKLIVIDSTLATATVGGVTGAITGSDITILAGTYGADVSAHLKNGYVQESGTVKNAYYEIVKNGNDITFQLNADVLTNRELPSVWLAGDMAADLAMNYFTTASLAFADADDVNAQNPYSIYAIVFDDLVDLFSDTVNEENVKAIIDILKRSGSSGVEEIANDLAALLSDIVDEERINEVLDILKLSGAGGIEGFLNDLMAKSMDFGALAKAINNNTELIKYNMVTAPWSITLDTVAGEDYLTVGIEPGEEVISSIAVTIVGTKENKDKIADVLTEMGKIMDVAKNSVTVTLQDPVYADKTLTVSGSGSVAIDIDMSQNSDYAAITAVALASGGVNKAEFVDALNAYFADRSDTDALYEALSEVTMAEYIEAVKNPDIIDGFSDMLTNLGVTSGSGSSAAELGDTYRMALVAVGRVLARLEIEGKDSVVFGTSGKISYTNSGVTRNVTRTAGDVTVSVTATVESISAVVKLFPDITCEHNYASVVTPPTCEDQGYTTYTCTGRCGHSYVADYVPATGHDWKKTEYSWAVNNSSCTAKRVCETDETHVETATVTTTSVVKTPAGCENAGTTTYTAIFTESWAVTQTKDVDDIQATGHDWKKTEYSWAVDNSSCTAKRVCETDETHVETETVTTTSVVKTPAGCESVGTTTYTATFTESWAVMQTQDVDDIQATGHDWKKTEYSWAVDNNSCTAKRVCETDETHVETATVTTTSVVKTPAGCENAGTTTYTAIFTESWAVTQTKDVDDIQATGHDWKKTEYSWAVDNNSCTAKRVCETDETHVETATATITSAVKTPAGCESVGTTTYTATFTESWAVTQTKDVDDIQATGHNWTWQNMGNGKHKGVCDATNPAHEVIENHVDANNDKKCDKCNASLSSGGGGGGSVSTKYKVEVAETENGTVTLDTNQASKNTKVTITATPDEGYKVVKVIVTDGNGVKLEVITVSESVYTFRMPGSAVTVEVVFECTGSNTTCPSAHLTDVDRSQWYHIAVDYAVVNGLMTGIGGNLFAPDADMDRAMIVQVLYNQEGQPAVEYTGKFTDVPDGKWYTDAIEWGVANHLIAGYGDGEFKPERKVSREEIATILHNYAKFKGVDISARGDLSKFSDGSTTSDWAVMFMQWAVGSGLMTGDGTNLYPTQTATRAEVAQMFKNFNEIFD